MVGSDSLSSLPSLSPPPAEKKQPPKQWGVTKPLSLAGPVDADIQRNKELEKVCCILCLLSDLNLPWLLIDLCDSHEMGL